MHPAKLMVLLPMLLAATFSPALAADAPQNVASLDRSSATGLKIDMTGITAETVDVNGQSADVWVSRQKSVPADEWARSFKLTFTDPAFKKGAAPVVDIDVTYLHPANTPVQVVADTARGSQIVGGAWGNKNEFQTLHVELNDAYFGARAHKEDPKTLPADGCDLRINAWAGDFLLKSVTVKAHDRKHPDDWSRFLAVDSVSDDAKFILTPGQADTLHFHLRNRALVTAPGVARFEFTDGQGKAFNKIRRDISLQADGTANMDVPFPTAGLATGEYGVRFAFDLPDHANVLQYEQTVVVAGPLDAFIVFDKTPIARGMTFDRTAFEPKLIDVNGVKHWVWAAKGGSARGGDGWWTSAVFSLTDPRFKNGKMPAADVSLTYRHIPNAPVSLFADTATGSRQVGFGWGNNPDWQTISCQLDDAKFNDTDYHSDPKALKTDGFDLRFNNCNDDAEIRSIFVRGYDLSDHPDYRRLFRFDGVDAGRDLFVFNPGENQDLKLKLRNISHVPLEADYRLTLSDDLGNVLWQKNKAITVGGDGPFVVPVPFDTAGLKQGVYTLGLSLGRTVKGQREEMLATSVNVAVSETSPIAKAQAGEFMYGVDPGVSLTDDPRWLKWLDFMGCDITRGNGSNENPDAWPAAFAALDQHHIKCSVFQDMPWDADPAKLDQKISDTAARAAGLAQKFADHTYYWELGNEPDLTFFYAGPIDAYAKAFTAVSHAIKQADPNTCVMNGGLSFAGPEADQRSRRFVEIVPADAIDAFAYHGHGPTDQAERMAYERIHAVAEKYGKANKPFVETESGVAADTPAQVRVQARTAVQKLVYAQSVGLPAFMWFRLNITGGDAGYTNTINAQEPRPAVLSYRTMVKTLRGRHFSKMLDLGSPDMEAYLFTQTRGPGRALVYWTHGRGGVTRTLQLAAHAGAVADCKMVDLFGNSKPVNVPSGMVTIAAENDPAFLIWNDSAQGAVGDVAVIPSPLEIDPAVTLTPGATETVVVRVKNSGDQPLTATLTAKTGEHSGLTLADATYPVDVPARSTAQVNMNVAVADNSDAIAWPQRWAVYTSLPANGYDAGSVTKMAGPLAVNGQPVKPTFVRLKDDHIDFAALAGTYKEKAEALAVAEITVPKACTIHVGASADWWMEWTVNGQRVWDDLANGNNGPQNILEHQFDMPLNAGKNVIAVRVLSGSQGWKLFCGGPEEVSAAKGASTGLGRALALELKQGDNVLAAERLPVQLRHAIPATGELTPNSPPADWDAAEPDGELVEANVTNEFAKQPDSSKWWRGDADLSARVWLRRDEKNLYAVVAVRDDVHRPAAAADIDIGDSVRLSLAGPDDKLLLLAVPGAGGAVYQATPGAKDAKPTWTAVDAANATATVERVDATGGGTTWYRITLRQSLWPADKFAANVQVNDNDFGPLKQVARWFPVVDQYPTAAAPWYAVYLPAKH